MLLLLTLMFGDLPYPMIHQFDDSTEVKGTYLTSPMSAVFWDHKLYISDDVGSTIFIIDPQGSAVTFGSAGEGPGRFSQTPDRLFVADDQLYVVEWNAWGVSTFQADGRFIAKQKLAKKIQPFPGVTLEKVSNETLLKEGHLYRWKERDCPVGGASSTDHLDLHINRTFFAVDEDGYVITAAGGGRLRAFAGQCQVMADMQLPVEHLKKEPVVDEMKTKLAKLTNFNKIHYKFGIPVIAVAARNRSQVWCLAQNEETGASWLYEADLQHKKIAWKTKLDAAFSGLSYHQGHLVLISRSEALVRVFKVAP